MTPQTAPSRLAALWPTRLWFARHGRTAMNISGLVQGSIDPPLDPLGEEDARQLAARLRGACVTRVLTSRLQRARQTGAIVAAALDVPLAADTRLDERAWGPWEGCHRDKRPPLRDPHGAEASAALAARVFAALEAVCALEPAEDTLVISHAGVFRTMIELLHLPPAGPLVFVT